MKHQFHKKLLSGILCLIFIACSACGAKDTSPSSAKILKEQKSFHQYTENLFVGQITKNTINLHYTLTNPKDYGIDNYPVTLGSMSAQNAGNARAALENISAALNRFDYDSLTTRQKLTLDILKDYCGVELSAADLYYYNEPLRATTGTHTELPILLAEYAFYRPSDVTDYLSLLSCVEDCFNDIILFEEEKSKQGLFMSEFAADAVIASCRSFTENPEENYLITTFNSRIASMEEISDEKKETYRRQNQSLVENAVIPAYEKLAAAMTRLRSTGNNSGGLCHFSNGISYYEYLVRSSTGSDKSVPALQKLTEQKRREDIAALQTLLAENPELINSSNDAPALTDDPEEILTVLQESMLKDFFPAVNGSYEVNYVDKSLETSLAPAFYLTAPLDDISHNVIYINGASKYSGIQLFTTLAHEGYPGHLYQTTGSYQANLEPIRAILNYPGYVEGWATYVEMISYQYAGLDKNYAEMLMRNQSALLSLYATIDMGIHYDGWSLADAAQFLGGYGIANADTVLDIYQLVVEEPAHYLKYYIGYLEFLELREIMENELQDSYSNRAFHQAVVRMGPAPFSILKKYLIDFYEM